MCGGARKMGRESSERERGNEGSGGGSGLGFGRVGDKGDRGGPAWRSVGLLGRGPDGRGVLFLFFVCLFFSFVFSFFYLFSLLF